MSDSPIIKNHAAFIWSVADILRGDYKQSEYGKVVKRMSGEIPMDELTVLLTALLPA